MARPKVTLAKHHKALPYKEMPAFMRRLQAMGMIKLNGMANGEIRMRNVTVKSMSALALKFTILTAARTSEVLLARRDEIDFEARLWTVPADRMKSLRIHRVPLCDRALDLLGEAWPFGSRKNGFIFVGRSGSGHLSSMALAMCLRGLEGGRATVHGMRSTFRDWAGDETEHAREVAEAALAHIVGDQSEQAYRRGDALGRRRELMNEWEACLSSEGRDGA